MRSGCKRKFLGCLGVFAVLVAIAVGYSYYRVYYVDYTESPPIEGVVVDEATGKPVDKVQVRCGWYFRGPTKRDPKWLVTVTDGNGRFQIPPKMTNGFLSDLLSQDLLLSHPLYEFKEIVVYSYVGLDYGEIRDGKIYANLKIMPMEARFTRPEDNVKLESFFSGKTARYFEYMKGSHNVKYDLKEILVRWERIVNMYPSTSPANIHLHKEYNRARKELLELSLTY